LKYYLITLLACCTFGLRAQTAKPFPDQQTTYGTLQFNTPFYDLEDHWVVFPKNEKTGKCTFYFIYVDNMAGYTLETGGNFGIDAQGRLFRDSTDYIKNALYKIRLGRNTKPVAAMPDAMLEYLKLKPVPDWLHIYHPFNQDRSSVDMKVMYGKFLNNAGEAKKALEYLEGVYKTEPHANGLEFELTYAYNELQQYNKAIAILDAAIAYAPNNALFYRELGYSYMKSNDLANAVKTYIKGITIAKQQHSETMTEMIVNLGSVYSQLQQYDKAIALLNNNIVYAPGNLPLYTQLAAIYLKSNDPDNAIKTYIAAIDAVKPDEMERKAEMAWSIARVYHNQKKDMELFKVWGTKAKDWAPANSGIGQALKNVIL
jgi:tetratricopeptide (TPR) repeat protein